MSLNWLILAICMTGVVMFAYGSINISETRMLPAAIGWSGFALTCVALILSALNIIPI